MWRTCIPRWSFILLAASALAPVTALHAQSPAPAASDKTGNQVSKSDQELMKTIAQANLGEIEGGKLALSQSNNDKVKAFAQKMIDEHTQAQQQLQQLAQAKGVELPTQPDSKHMALAKHLASLKGDAFDKEYVAKGGLSDHREAHALMQKIQKNAHDSDLKSLASKMSPTIDQHLSLAKDLSHEKMTTSGSSK
jgi:putative membrane protein